MSTKIIIIDTSRNRFDRNDGSVDRKSDRKQLLALDIGQHYQSHLIQELVLLLLAWDFVKMTAFGCNVASPA